MTIEFSMLATPSAIDESQLDASVNASLDLADSAIQISNLFPVYIPAERMSSLGGSPSLSQSGGTALDRMKYWLMDSAATETIGSSFLVPSGVATVNVKIRWAPTGLAGGNVVFKLTYANRTVGDVAHNGSASGSNITVAAPTSALINTDTTLASGISTTTGNTFRFAVERLGADGADTYASDVGIYGVFIERAS